MATLFRLPGKKTILIPFQPEIFCPLRIPLTLQARSAFYRNSCGTRLSLADDASHKVDANGLTKAQVEVIDEVLGALQQALRDESGLWTADYVRLKFRAHLPNGECIG